MAKKRESLPGTFISRSRRAGMIWVKLCAPSVPRTTHSPFIFSDRARGDHGPDSYDLLLVVNDDVPEECNRSRLAYEVLKGASIAADVLICTRSYFDARRNLRASLPGTVLREGRLLQVE